MNTVKAIEHQEIVPAPVVTLTPADMLHAAIEKGLPYDRIMDLYERWEAGKARRAFESALADARADIPTILKNRTVDFTTQKGRTRYQYEDLAEIARTVDPVLAKHGLSYRWRTTSVPNEPVVTVTCIVSHRMGHIEENSLCAARDESGNKNSIQSIGSTVTYLQRYTLKAALGLAASNDDDGRAASGVVECITVEQVAEIENLLNETSSSAVLFLKHIKLESLADIRADKFDAVKKLIIETAAKRDAMQKGKQS